MSRPFGSIFSRPNDAPRNSRGNHSSAACWRRAFAASSSSRRGEQVGAALQDRGGLSRAGGRNGDSDVARHDARRVDGLIADQHRNAMARHGRQRLERWNGRTCLRRFGLRALDVERGGEPGALPRRNEVQRCVLRRRDGAQGLELPQRARQREIVAGDIRQHQQAHAAYGVFASHGVGGCRGRTGAQAARDVNFPGDVQAAGERLRIRRRRDCLPDGRAVAGVRVRAAGADTDAWPQP